MNYINSIADKTDCANKRFISEIHGDENNSTIDSQYIIPSLVNKNNKINFDFFVNDNSLLIPS